MTRRDPKSDLEGGLSMNITKLHMQNKKMDGCFGSGSFLVALLDKLVSLQGVVELVLF